MVQCTALNRLLTRLMDTLRKTTQKQAHFERESKVRRGLCDSDLSTNLQLCLNKASGTRFADNAPLMCLELDAVEGLDKLEHRKRLLKLCPYQGNLLLIYLRLFAKTTSFPKRQLKNLKTNW